MKFFKPSRLWFEIWSDMFVNLSAGWFGIIFIVPNIILPSSVEEYVELTSRLLLGILSLIVAKFFREKAKKWK